MPAARRLRRIILAPGPAPGPAASIFPTGGVSGVDGEVVGSSSAPPRLLSDRQMASFVENGFLALPVSELSDEWHSEFAQATVDWNFQGTEEPQRGRHSTHLPMLTELCNSPTVTGALASILGDDYCMYPNRMLQAYGPPDRLLELQTGDQTWCPPAAPLCTGRHGTESLTAMARQAQRSKLLPDPAQLPSMGDDLLLFAPNLSPLCSPAG